MYIEYGVDHKKLNSMSVINIENQNTKIFLKRATFQIDLKSLCDQENKKILCLGHMLLVISTLKGLLKHSMKNSCKRQAKKKPGLKK